MVLLKVKFMARADTWRELSGRESRAIRWRSRADSELYLNREYSLFSPK